MSQMALFTFGCVIFFVTITGALLYGMHTLRDLAERDSAAARAKQTPNT